MKSIRLLTMTFSFLLSLQSPAQICLAYYEQENVVQIINNQIVVNGKAQPGLYGAELQYFRLRGGYEIDVPRKKVIEIWARALDNMVKAGMNSLSFYIPWDFHEYAPGKFDFNGTVDSNGSGKPDYPSRDILTFLKMAEERGIKKIMIRPGPYVNAEWGFLGFGAVPKWFHEKYPDSHMVNAKGQKTKLYDYHNPDFLRHTKLWFEELNRQVLVNVIGKDKPGIFLQLDNETNFQWQSIYNHDYGEGAVSRYQTFLKNRYRTLEAINKAQNTSVTSWKQVAPPTVAGLNLAKDQDWYRFQDRSIYDYLKKVKVLWNEVGVKEPNVLFTVAESFNAPKDGLLPNYKFRNAKNAGLMTINVYPKTWPSADNVLFHQPHKSDYDIIAAASSSKYHLGKKQEAVIGPEIHTGWFGNTILSPAARQQTYLTLLGRGMKALYFYYFNEGNNWQVEWGKQQIQPFYEKLRNEPRYNEIASAELPDAFWIELQTIVDSQFMVGWNPKHVLLENIEEAQKLKFGTPLDGEARPTKHFELIKEIGQRIIKPYGDFLSQSTSLVDKVAIIADTASLAPSPIPGIDSRELHSDFAGGLVGYIMQSGINPSIHHWGINSTKELATNKIIFVQDSGNLNPRLVKWLAKYVENGGTVVNFIGDSIAKEIGAPTAEVVSTQLGAVAVRYADRGSFDGLAGSVTSYSIAPNSPAKSMLTTSDKIVGYKMPFQKGLLVQMGLVIHDAFNTGAYALLNDIPQRRAILDDLIAEKNVRPHFQIAEKIERVEVFGRRAPGDERLWITVKSGQLQTTEFHVKVRADLISKKYKSYKVTNTLTGESQSIQADKLVSVGLSVKLLANGSAALIVAPE